MKTARFASVVAHSGAPETYQLWVAPAKDRTFQKALNDCRVLTVHQENVGAKKDYGTVGYREEPHAQYLLFPKSLRHFAGRRIIGIDYQLLVKESRPGTGPKPPANLRRAKPAGPPARRKSTLKQSPRAELLPFPNGRNADRAKGTAPENKPASHRSKPDTHEPLRAKRPALTMAPPGRISREIRHAMKELKAGKTVAAYERLGKLVDNGQAT